MEVSEVRVKLVGNSKDRLKAYCSITIDECFVVRDLKVIDGSSGLFVAMPSRKLCARCPSCGSKNHLRARYCNECGSKLEGHGEPSGHAERDKLHADIAHPINAECREFIQSRVIEAYEAELENARDPGYRGAGYDEGYDEDTSPYEGVIAELKSGASECDREQTGADQVKTCPGSQTDRGEHPAEAPDGPAPATPGEDAFGAGIL